MNWNDCPKDTAFTNDDLVQKINDLPPDFQCRALFIGSDNITHIPNLRRFRQFDKLMVLVIFSKSVIILEGLPSGVELIMCPANLHVMAKECFLSEVTHNCLKELHLNKMKQPPKEVVKMALQDVQLYYKDGHRLLVARNRSVYLETFALCFLTDISNDPDVIALCLYKTLSGITE